MPTFSVSLVQPVDHYQLNERAAKYALLFIGLTFISFFMFELLKGLRVHPIQYALVGMGLAIFYLVLLALTEHLGFGWAYLVAALASVLLNGFYLSHVLGGPKQGIGFAALLGLVYAILYSLLQAEEIALLLGALLLVRHPGADHDADPQARLVSGDGLQRPRHHMGGPPVIDQ